MDPTQVGAALAGLDYPVHLWQVLAQADYYGADIKTRTELALLPERLYPDLASVVATVAHRLSNGSAHSPSARR